jgi:hypothetical protein
MPWKTNNPVVATCGKLQSIHSPVCRRSRVLCFPRECSIASSVVSEEGTSAVSHSFATPGSEVACFAFRASRLVRCGLLRLQSGCGCGFYSIFLSMDCSCSSPNSCNSVGLQPAEHALATKPGRRSFRCVLCCAASKQHQHVLRLPGELRRAVPLSM